MLSCQQVPLVPRSRHQGQSPSCGAAASGGAIPTERLRMPWWSRSTAWNKMSTPKRAIAGTGSVVGILFIYLIFFWFFILRFF